MKLGVIALVMALVMIGGVMAAIFEEETTPASVTVNTFVSTTISKCGDTAFGSNDPGTNDNKVVCQSSADMTAPAVSISVDAVTNINVDIGLKGSPFLHTDVVTTFPVTNAAYDDDCNLADVCPATAEGLASGTMSGTYAKYFLNVASGSSNKLWFWLDIPTSQKAGSYSSTFSFKTVEQGTAI